MATRNSSIAARPEGIALSALVVIAFALSAATAVEPLDVEKNNPNRLVLHFCEIDGTPIRPLISDAQFRNRLDRQGTPDVSADGKRVAFDAWASGPEFTWEESRIVVADIDGANAADISDGVMPSFSPDGRKLAVSRPPKYAKEDGAKGMSIWTMDTDGANKQMIADQGAWGALWSPDGKSLVFYGGIDEEGKNVAKNCLRLYDFSSKKITNVFDPQESPFSDLSFHFDWCKEKKRLVVFGGPLKDGKGTGSATIDVDLGIKSLAMLPVPKDGTRVIDGMSFDWHPDGTLILVTGVSEGRPFPVAIPTTKTTTAPSFSGIPKTVGVRDPAYTPDGKNLLASFFSLETN